MIAIAINYWAVLACGVLSMVLGFLWYGPIFGKQYMRMQGVTQEEAKRMMENPKMRSKMMRNYFFTFVLALITAFVYAHFLVFVEAFFQTTGVVCTFMITSLCWFGFIVPVTTNLIFFDKKHWDWWFLVNGYYLIQLSLIGVALALWV